jgi:hypothetical protein
MHQKRYSRFRISKLECVFIAVGFSTLLVVWIFSPARLTRRG